MEIQTKYNVGDNVLLKRLNDNEVEGTILHILIKVVGNCTEIRYLIKIQDFVLLKFTEEELNKVV